ncbi:MAG: phospholipid transport system transporter-binding protein [Alteromonadaceae bacterium]|jgi:phospholipid transport system transporter-binding protein
MAQLDLTLMGGKSMVVGELIRTTITKSFETKSKNLFSSQKMIVDLSQVKKVDTAGLAWLLYIVEQANLKSCSLTFIHVPQELLKLAALSGVDSFIPK